MPTSGRTGGRDAMFVRGNFDAPGLGIELDDRLSRDGHSIDFGSLLIYHVLALTSAYCKRGIYLISVALCRAFIAQCRPVLVVLVAACAAVACSVRVPLVVDRVGPVRSEPIVTSSGTQPSAQFGKLFCGVLNHRPDAGDWGYCEQYFSPSGTPDALAALPAQPWRILVLPGIFGGCVEAVARPFADAAEHMRAAHGYASEYLSLSALGGASYNGQQIATYLDAQFAGSDQRPYVVVAYSKGASDVLQALVDVPRLRPRIRAVITVAGSVLGSRLAEDAPRGILDALQHQQLGNCSIGDGKGLESLRRSERVREVARLSEVSGPRYYSIPAVSDASTTSAVLANGWNRLRAFSLEQDSQVLHEDAIVPGATYLGMARGDHWAVALPFEAASLPPAQKKALLSLVNHNHFPRAALFEAALRFVANDLSSRP